MPNYKLSTAAKEQISNECNRLCGLRLGYARRGFPLTVDDVQACAAAPEVLAQLKDLKSEHNVEVPVQQAALLMLHPDQIAGLERPAIIKVALPREIIVGRSHHLYGDLEGGKKLQQGNLLIGFYFTNNLFRVDQRVSEAHLRALARWANHLIKIHRVNALTEYAVCNVLTGCTTTGHIVARWPILGTLFTDDLWRKRMQSPPERLMNYAYPVGEPMPEFLNYMRAAETVILGAQMLAPFEWDTKKEIVPALCRYEGLPGDRF